MPPTIDGLTGKLRVSRHGHLVTISVHGRLDPSTGVELLASVQAALEDGATRIDVDLLGIEDHSPEGARALRRCRSLARTLPDGLHFRTAAGPAQDALLDAFADGEDLTGEVPVVGPLA